MNVGQLKKLLEDADDSDPVILAGRDHSFLNSYIEYSHCLQEVTGQLSEYHSDVPLEPGQKVLPCIIVLPT